MTTSYAEARPSYIADAFSVQYNLILLGGAALFSLASASPLPLGCALILEAIYLLVAPNLAAFRRYADSRYLKGQRVSDAIGAAALELDVTRAARAAGFARALSEVQNRLRTPQALPLALALDRLDGAAPAFAGLCQLDQRLERALAASSQAELEAELSRLQAACEVEPDAMQKVSLRLAQNTTKRKLAQSQELSGKQRAIQLRLERIEQAMQQAGALGGQELAQRLDSVAVDLSALQALKLECESLPAS